MFAAADIRLSDDAAATPGPIVTVELSSDSSLSSVISRRTIQARRASWKWRSGSSNSSTTRDDDVDDVDDDTDDDDADDDDVDDNDDDAPNDIVTCSIFAFLFVTSSTSLSSNICLLLTAVG